MSGRERVGEGVRVGEGLCASSLFSSALLVFAFLWLCGLLRVGEGETVITTIASAPVHCITAPIHRITAPVCDSRNSSGITQL